MKNVLESVLRFADRTGASRVDGVVLRVGELNDFESEWVQRYFDYLSRGTIAEGATVTLRVIPIVIECARCGEEFRIPRERMADFACPECGCGEGEMVAGRELVIDRIEIEH